MGDFAAAPLGAGGEQSARRLQSVLASIRNVPGLRQFATGTADVDLGAALEPGFPLLYESIPRPTARCSCSPG